MAIRRQDILTTTNGLPEHPGHVCTAGVDVGIQYFFGPPSHDFHTTTSVNQEMMDQLTQKIT
ncbi:hypothetical protein E2542_SST25042 [Spatholobus suberectus]|nr:hypothetical protein E2542_SST25042 [Spatholobus suberectus]